MDVHCWLVVAAYSNDDLLSRSHSGPESTRSVLHLNRNADVREADSCEKVVIDEVGGSRAVVVRTFLLWPSRVRERSSVDETT